jgi:hypothetical protein
MLIRFLTPFYAPDTDQGSGGAAVTPAEPAQQPQQGYTRLTERNGNDAGAVATLLYQENYQLRQRIRDLEGRLPKEGERDPRWRRCGTLGSAQAHNPADVAAALAERDTLKAQVTETARKETIRKAADAAGLKASVLERLPGLPPVEVTEVDGKAIAHVVTDAGKVPLHGLCDIAVCRLLARPPINSAADHGSAVAAPADRGSTAPRRSGRQCPCHVPGGPR